MKSGQAGIGWGLGGALMAAALLLAACGDRNAPERPPMPGDTAVARVNGKVVWTSDVKAQAVEQGMITEGEPLDPASEVFRQMLQEVIDRKLLAAEAAKRGLDRDAAAQRRLATQRERVLADLVLDSEISRAVTDNAVRGLYEEQRRLAHDTEEIRFRHIIVATQEEAEQVRRMILGGTEFGQLAMQRSIDPSTRFEGGEMGYFTTDLLPEPYVEPLRSAQVGAVVGPFRIDKGWVVVKVEDRRPETPISFEDARPQIIRFISFDQIKDVVERLRSAAKVEYLTGPVQDVPGRPEEPASAPAAKGAPAPGEDPTPSSRPPAAAPAGKAKQ